MKKQKSIFSRHWPEDLVGIFGRNKRKTERTNTKEFIKIELKENKDEKK